MAYPKGYVLWLFLCGRNGDKDVVVYALSP